MKETGFVFLVLIALFVKQSFAQAPPKPRLDDEFWKRKTKVKVDLTEKVNEPLITDFDDQLSMVHQVYASMQSNELIGYADEFIKEVRTFEEIVDIEQTEMIEFSDINLVYLTEDRIFDKNSAQWFFDPQVLSFTYVFDDGRPENQMAHFKWEELKPVLRKAIWKNPFNEAEFRTALEIFELRLFHGIIVQESRVPVYTLIEAEERKQDQIEFEHHLWSY